MIVKLLTEHHLEFLSLKGGCRGSSESTLVKMSNCWKSHAVTRIVDFAKYLEYKQSLTTASETRLFGSVVRTLALTLVLRHPGFDPQPEHRNTFNYACCSFHVLSWGGGMWHFIRVYTVCYHNNKS